MSKERTKGPWKTGPRSNIVQTEDGGYVAFCGMNRDALPGSVDDSENEANAAFIVRACNAHDELVEALRWYQEKAESAARYASRKDRAEATTALFVELGLDGGRRALAAITKATVTP